jgi:uncharacterized protein with von Willebrand factor type A (vWA) domain
VLIRFLSLLREAGIPVSVTEYLALLESLKAGIADTSVDNFYVLARTILVKDERYYDRYDRVFAAHFSGIESMLELLGGAEIPDDWLKRLAELHLSPEEKAKIEALGGLEKVMEALKERLKEQQGRHQGGSKWIGTAGRSPFGAYGYNPEGVRIGQDASRQRSAIKVWDRREFRNLDDSLELGTRNLQVALRRLRRFAREGAAEELDLDSTIHATARNAGWLDLKLRPERHNAVKILLFLDVGGSMDDYVKVTEELFSAARNEFRHLEHYYFHNFVYESVWKDNRRRYQQRIPMQEVLRTYGPDYRLIFVGDATMGPYEILRPGGSVEHWNEEAGSTWLGRLTSAFPRFAWLNPQPENRWEHIPSIGVARQLLDGRMYPLTPAGLDRATRVLNAR